MWDHAKMGPFAARAGGAHSARTPGCAHSARTPAKSGRIKDESDGESTVTPLKRCS